MNEKKWEQENVLRLVKKSRKGVLRVVFSRFGLMALLLILELVLLWMMWRWFNNDFEWFAAVQGVFTVLMFFHLFNSDMDATGKLTWMFLLAVIPIPASIFLWFTEKDVGHRTLKRMVQQRIDESRDLLHQDPEVLRDPEIESSGTDDLCRYLNRSGSFPLYANTETKFFPQGEDKFAALLEELQKAEKFIFQSRLHLVVQNEIGRHDMHVVLGPVEDVHIDALPHLIIVQWTVAVGHHIALRLHRRRGQQRLVPAGFLLRQVPHL